MPERPSIAVLCENVQWLLRRAEKSCFGCTGKAFGGLTLTQRLWSSWTLPRSDQVVVVPRDGHLDPLTYDQILSKGVDIAFQ